ncbi:hypothetical protein JOM56_002278 [Amanita muscaria]
MLGERYAQDHFRASRTDLDFEQALRQDGTVKIRQSVDVSSLGMDISQDSALSVPQSPPSSLAASPKNQPTTPNDVFSEQEDAERRSKRRSIYRSPGTSSSPDLATLVRKARERGGGVVHGPRNYSKEKRKDSPPPMPLPLPQDQPPNSNAASTRPRSSTSRSLNPPIASSTSSSTYKGGRDRTARGALTDVVPEWFMTSPRPPKQESKPIKSSVKQKTAELFGKMLGQTSSKDRMRSAPSTFSGFPVPANIVENNRSTTSRTQEMTATISSQSTALSPTRSILLPRTSSPVKADDENSVVFVDPPPRSRSKDVLSEQPSSSKRSSTGVENADGKESLSKSSSMADCRIDDDVALEDITLHGIIDDFKGQLSSLDPTNLATFDLRDPSTPARRLMRPKVNAANLLEAKEDPGGDGFKQSASCKEQLQLYNPAESDENGVKLVVPSPIVPPRLSSLKIPPRSPVPHTYRARTADDASSPFKTWNEATGITRDTNRSRVMHRPTASNSEPSLVAVGNSSHTLNTFTSSQYESTDKEVMSNGLSSNSSVGGDVVVDAEKRGKELAAKCWNEDTSFLSREKMAEYLGGQGHANKIALRHYVSFFDFSGLRLDLAFRRFCSKLYLKAETQQVDRILEEFSKRYWECSSSSLYGSASIVHAVTYSLLLLNTDLHVADLTTHMSRSQFVRNTMATIRAQLQPNTDDSLPHGPDRGMRATRSEEVINVGRAKRSDSITSWNSVSREVVMSLPSPFASSNPPIEGTANDERTSVATETNNVEATTSNSGNFYTRGWENEIEVVLKEMYNAIKTQQISQPLNTIVPRLSVSSLSPNTGMLRNRSLRSQPDRLTTLKRGSIRGLQSIIAQSGAAPYGSSTSTDGRVSPSSSLAISANEFHCSSSSFLTPALGFASNLSNTIIREMHEDDDHSIGSDDTASTSISITDEELALLGAPWAKEGMLCRKQYWESAGKRSKDRSWLDVFVVIQKGELNMFTFNRDSAAVSGNVIGGGNWLANAHHVGIVQLAHSLSHSLPPPGYNRQRPHCMVLTLANGGVYFFQAGTEELVNEWVSTCNYWAARISKEPLAGGVSNMEYGWNRVASSNVPNNPRSEDESPREKDHTDTMSIRSSRSNRSRFGWREGVSTVRHGHSPWADKIYINDWKPPLPPAVASTHDEETQLEALRKHVVYLKNDLERHNELREPMATLYQPRTATALKAQSNWEKKSQYILTEIVKYESYIDSLQSAMSLRLKKRGEKALERALDEVLPPDPNEAKG